MFLTEVIASNGSPKTSVRDPRVRVVRGLAILTIAVDHVPAMAQR
jgi:hypothetical protein